MDLRVFRTRFIQDRTLWCQDELHAPLLQLQLLSGAAHVPHRLLFILYRGVSSQLPVSVCSLEAGAAGEQHGGLPGQPVCFGPALHGHSACLDRDGAALERL